MCTSTAFLFFRFSLPICFESNGLWGRKRKNNDGHTEHRCGGQTILTLGCCARTSIWSEYISCLRACSVDTLYFVSLTNCFWTSFLVSRFDFRFLHFVFPAPFYTIFGVLNRNGQQKDRFSCNGKPNKAHRKRNTRLWKQKGWLLGLWFNVFFKQPSSSLTRKNIIRHKNLYQEDISWWRAYALMQLRATSSLPLHILTSWK